MHRVVVIGGGVVGCSVLYHLAQAGWTDVVLLERDELTSGSTWHAAGGMHTINGDPNVAKLQKYTIELYKEIEELSGQATGVHITGGVMLAATEARMDWLRGVVAKGRYLGLDIEVISAEEAHELMPLLDEAVRRRGPQLRGRPCRSVRRDPCLRQGRAQARRRGRALHQGRGHRAAVPTARGTSSPTRARSSPSMSSTPAGCGRARSAAWSGSSCRCSRWSTCT